MCVYSFDFVLSYLLNDILVGRFNEFVKLRCFEIMEFLRVFYRRILVYVFPKHKHLFTYLIF